MNSNNLTSLTALNHLSDSKTLDNLLLRTPYRYGTLLIDRVTYFEPDKYLSAIKNITRNDKAYNSTDTDQYPNLYILEALIQACTIVATYNSIKQTYSCDQDLVTEIDQAKFKNKVVAGDQLLISVNVLNKKPYAWKMETEVCTEETQVATACVTLAKK